MLLRVEELLHHVTSDGQGAGETGRVDSDEIDEARMLGIWLDDPVHVVGEARLNTGLMQLQVLDSQAGKETANSLPVVGRLAQILRCGISVISRADLLAFGIL